MSDDHGEAALDQSPEAILASACKRYADAVLAAFCEALRHELAEEARKS